MKILAFCLTLLCTTTTVFSQSLEGIYSNSWESSNSTLTYTLNLKDDGAFEFEYYRTYNSDVEPVKTIVTGKWIQDDRVLTLTTEANEGDDILVKKLNNSKARFVSLSPRHPKFNSVQPSLKFYPSDAFHAKDMELLKAESSVTSVGR